MNKQHWTTLLKVVSYIITAILGALGHAAM